MSEAALMREIMLALSADGHTVFRANVGQFFTKDGRPIRTGLPTGFSDLFGLQAGTARVFFLEVKTPTGRVTDQQARFLCAMGDRGAITGIARSVDEARQLLGFFSGGRAESICVPRSAVSVREILHPPL